MLANAKGHVYAPLAVLALWMALLIAPPAVAEAQEMDPTKAAPGRTKAADTVAPPGGGDDLTVQVRPGDSLWSISQERLGPNAREGRIVQEAARIYALNRGRIGGDPNLIFPGQRLLVPPAPRTPVSAREAAAERAPRPAERSGFERRGAPARDVAPETVSRGARSPNVGPAALPDPPKAGVAPEAGSLVAEEVSPPSAVSSAMGAVTAIADRVAAVAGSLAEVRYDGRRLLGLGCFTMAFLAAIGLVVRAARATRERRRVRRRMAPRKYGGHRAYSAPRGGLEGQPAQAGGRPEPERSTEDAGPEAAGESRANSTPAGARTVAAGARKLKPKDPTPKDPRPAVRGARDARGER